MLWFEVLRIAGVLLVAIAALAVPASAAATPGYRIVELYPFPSSGYTPGTVEKISLDGCGGIQGPPFRHDLYDTPRGGGTFSDLVACYNGRLIWGGAISGSAKTCGLPIPNQAAPMLAPYWTASGTHSIVGADYGIYTKTEGTAPDRRYIVEWRQFRVSDSAKRTFEVILQESSPVVTVLYSTFLGGSDAAVGVQNSSSTGQATAWDKCGATAITNGLRLDFVPDPLMTARPRIMGQPFAGVQLNGDRGTWEGTEPMTFAYQWRRCDPIVTTSCVNIQGANELTYTPSSVEVNQGLRLRVFVTTPYGNDVADSDASALVAPPPVAGSTCTVEGTEGPDTLLGTAGPDVICGRGGNDRIAGLGGDDIVLAGGGNDAVSGGPGADQLLGSSGKDNLTGGGGNDIVNGGAGADRVVGGGGWDSLLGGGGRDFLLANGDRATDRLNGGRGRDRGRWDRRDRVRSVEVRLPR
ncbi:MAG: calcium-binding protein [Gaiellales bacterium]